MLKAGALRLSAGAVYRLGTVLVWLGVLTWAPFIFLRVLGEKPPFWWFLPFHLIGVVGGAHLRRLARKAMEAAPEQGNSFTATGHLLILTGVLVWVPYAYLKYVQGVDVEMMNFLPFHLVGVFGGLGMLGIGVLQRRK